MVNLMKWLFGSTHGADGANDDDQARRLELEFDPVVPGFPAELLKYHRAIEATRKPILAATILEGVPEEPHASQLGGLPWWPADRPYPTDTSGKPLHLLAQINFDDAPVLEGFPQHGLLQVFIGRDQFYGANLDDLRAPAGFACVYHPSTNGPARTDFEGLTGELYDLTPLEDPFVPIPLSFSHGTMVIDASDYRVASAVPGINDDDDRNDLFADLNFDTAPIRLGGYATFTQIDPRESDPSLGDIALLTIDSTDGVLWGDNGAGQILITAEALAARDFSKAVYNWDCC